MPPGRGNLELPGETQGIDVIERGEAPDDRPAASLSANRPCAQCH
jgi:hypothetical protein